MIVWGGAGGKGGKGNAHAERAGDKPSGHPPVAEPDQRRQGGSEQKQEGCLSIGRGDRGNVGAGVDSDGQQVELAAPETAA